MPLLVTAAGVLFISSDSAGAATLLRTLDVPRPEAYTYFGWSVAMGDVDGDGTDDVAVGAPATDVGGFYDQGQVHIYSGATGSLIRTLNTPNHETCFVFVECPRFGHSLALGDTNGDGKADALVGSPGENVGTAENHGRTYLFSGADGSLLRTMVIAASGRSVAMGDVNGDGRQDVIEGQGCETMNRVCVFDGVSGATIRRLDSPSSQNGTQFGLSLATGDANGDGRSDILVGASWEDGSSENEGRAYLFDGATGTLLRTLSSPNPQYVAYFGQSIAMGDADGDGQADLLIAAPLENRAQVDQGRVYLFSGATGLLLSTLDTSDPTYLGFFGHALSMGDMNSDGRGDPVVGTPYENGGLGRVYIFSGDTPVMLSTIETPDQTGGFGSALAAGDANADSQADLAVGAGPADVGGRYDQGRAYVLTLANDSDGDGVPDTTDNCPSTANPDQGDIDSDGTGDACDSDIDGDAAVNENDNCPMVSNPSQSDIDGDGTGDVCDPDADGDGVPNTSDVCPLAAGTPENAGCVPGPPLPVGGIAGLVATDSTFPPQPAEAPNGPDGGIAVAAAAAGLAVLGAGAYLRRRSR